MNIIVMMLLISLALSLGFLLAFLWAAKRGQFKDLTTPSWRVVLEENQITAKEGDTDAK